MVIITNLNIFCSIQKSRVQYFANPLFMAPELVSIITCKIFSDNRFPPSVFLSSLLTDDWLDVLVKTDSLLKVGGLLVSIAGGVAGLIIGVGVTVVTQVLAALCQFLLKKSSGKEEKKSIEFIRVRNCSQ